MKKKAAMKRRAMKAAAAEPAPIKAMRAMKVMKKKAAMKRAMKAAAPAAPMKAMRVMKKKAAKARHEGSGCTKEGHEGHESHEVNIVSASRQRDVSILIYGHHHYIGCVEHLDEGR